MKSLYLTIGFISFMMLLCKCQLSNSSPAGIRPDGEQIHTKKENTVENMIAQNGSADIPIENAMEDPILDMVSTETRSEENGILGEESVSNGTREDLPMEDTAKDAIIDDAFATASRRLHPRMKPIHDRKVNITNDHNVELMKGSKQTGAHIKINTSEHVADNGRKDLLFKHDHLTNFLFGSNQIDNTPTPVDNSANNENRNNSISELSPLARSIFKGKTKNANDFQARSDINIDDRLAPIVNSSIGQVDRSFEIDAAGMVEDSVSLSDDKELMSETNPPLNEREDSKGLLHFLRSLFGL